MPKSDLSDPPRVGTFDPQQLTLDAAGRRTWIPGRTEVRIVLAILGMLGVAAAELLRTSAAQSTLADVAAACLLVAALLALFTRAAPGLLVDRRSADICRVGSPLPHLGAPTARGPAEAELVRFGNRNRNWRKAQVGTTIAVGALVQTWFVSGAVIAAGDITPPVGTAWVNRLFAAVVWNGSNLGSINEAQQRLPWAVVAWVTNALGGSGALAQRIWLTFLLMGVAFAATALARALNLSPLAGVAAGLLYAFNPYVMSTVGVNDVFLLGTVLLAALPALVIASAKGSLPRWVAAAGLGLSGPLVGYVYSNPPLVGMLIFAVVASVPLAGARYGRPAASRSVPVVLGGGLLMAAASAYWVVPAVLAVREVAVSTLSPISAWTWTESRATIANALWLNAQWSWKYPVYVPFASSFSRLPLLLVRALVPAVAFLPLAFPQSRLSGMRLRATGAISVGTLAVIALSTGTNPPGNFIFDFLYRLPYGWLLQQPGRFLMVASLGFALMAGILIDGARPSRPISFRSPRRPRRSSGIRGFKIWSMVACSGVALAAAGSYPLWTGSIVSGRRPPFPSSHVVVPRYWAMMTTWLNSPHSTHGALLVLPPDDFYQMPYTWYYGNDGFITDLVTRHVIDPSPETYYLVSNELLAATRLEATAIASGDWLEGKHLLSAMGTPVILVRGDIVADFPDRSIISPTLLERQLLRDPFMRLVHRDGPLSAFALVGGVAAPTHFATVNSTSPDLRALSFLPPHTALVTSNPISGHVAIYQLPPVATWQVRGDSLVVQLSERTGWSYQVANLALGGGAETSDALWDSNQIQGSSGTRRISVTLPLGSSVIRDGSFRQGQWGTVGNCADFQPVTKGDVLSAAVLAHGGPAGAPLLQLSASVDAACESQTLSWHGGPLLVRMAVRSQSGATPNVCFWEEPVHKCAPAAPLPGTRTWKEYETVVSPSAGTKTVSLFLYADSNSPGQTSRDSYADITVRSLPAAPSLAVIATPSVPATPVALDSSATGFGVDWVGPTGGRHVEIDGLTNGWILPVGVSRSIDASYIPARQESMAEVIAAFVGTLLAGLVGILELGRRRWRPSGSTRARTDGS